MDLRLYAGMYILPTVEKDNTCACVWPSVLPIHSAGSRVCHQLLSQRVASLRDDVFTNRSFRVRPPTVFILWVKVTRRLVYQVSVLYGKCREECCKRFWWFFSPRGFLVVVWRGLQNPFSISVLRILGSTNRPSRRRKQTETKKSKFCP